MSDSTTKGTRSELDTGLVAAADPASDANGVKIIIETLWGKEALRISGVDWRVGTFWTCVCERDSVLEGPWQVMLGKGPRKERARFLTRRGNVQGRKCSGRDKGRNTLAF